MDERKEIKLSLTTVIILFLIFLVLVVVGGMYFCCRCIPRLKEELSVTPENINEVVETNMNKIEEQENSIALNLSNDEKTIYTHDEMEKILKKQDGLEEFRVTSVEKQNDGYIVTVDHFVPQIITETEYYQMKEKQIITLNGKEYVYKNDKESQYIYNEGYGYVINSDDQNGSDGYTVIKYNNGFAFYREIGGVTTVLNKINKTINTKLDKDTVVVEFPFIKEEEKTLGTIDWNDEFIKNNKITLVLSEYYNEEICLLIDNR